MEIKFEKVSRFENEDLTMPIRKTIASAGYDICAAEDIIIPTWEEHYMRLDENSSTKEPKTLAALGTLTKVLGAKPTLIPTGIKCKMGQGQYLELSVRSSCPLKYWIILANGVGIIDADYYNNPDNEGEIFFQVINLSPFPIHIQKGEAIGQGIIKNYITTDDDNFNPSARIGGFGSTS